LSGHHDPGLDTLLDLDGQMLFVDPEGGHWVNFIVTRVPASPEKPHGLDYSLTLHGPSGERLVGFDNAHPADRMGVIETDQPFARRPVKSERVI